MPNTPIRTAVLGYGLAGRVFHCPFVSAVPGLQLDAVVQRHGNEAAETYPAARILRSPEAAFADPGIDLIVVATPNDTHESLAHAALAAGKHVVVDKPVAPTPEAMQSLIEAATRAGKLLIPFHNRRWDGDFLTLQKLLRDNTLGHVVKVISQWDRFRPFPRAGSWKEASGDAHGMLQDLGPHLLDQALTLFGTPQHITASVRRDRENSAIEDAFDLVLTYTHAVPSPGTATQGTSTAAAPLSPGNRQLSTEHYPPSTENHPLSTENLHYECHVTMVAADPSPRFRVHGTHGSYTKHGLDPQEPHLVAGGRLPPTLGSSVPWIEEGEAAWGTLTLAPNPDDPNHLLRSTLPTLTGDYRLFYAGVRDAILNLAPPPVPATAALQVAQLIELARQSSHEQRTLEVHLT